MLEFPEDTLPSETVVEAGNRRGNEGSPRITRIAPKGIG